MNQDGTSLSLQPTIKAHISQWPEEARLLECVATNGVTSTQHPGGKSYNILPHWEPAFYCVLFVWSGFQLFLSPTKGFPLNISKIKALFLKKIQQSRLAGVSK